MKLEIRKSGGDSCATCGSYPLIAVLQEPNADPVELRTFLADALVPVAPWWRLFKKRWARKLATRLESVETELFELTKYPIASD